MQSRLIHLNLRVDKDDWLAWADKNFIDYRIKGFINFRPALLHNFNPRNKDQTFSSPRTWEFLSKIIKPYNKIDKSKLPIIAGTVSTGVAYEFISFIEIYDSIPTINQIVKNPNIEIKSEPSIHYAVSAMVGENIKESNIKPLLKFINKLPIEYRVICLRQAIRRDPSMINNSHIEQWKKDYEEIMF